MQSQSQKPNPYQIEGSHVLAREGNDILKLAESKSMGECWERMQRCCRPGEVSNCALYSSFPRLVEKKETGQLLPQHRIHATPLAHMCTQEA